MIIHQLTRRRAANGKRGAFTLLEVLVVVAILVVLASVASIYVFGELENAKRKKAEIQAKVISDACKNFYIKYDQLPPSIESLLNPGQGEKPLIEGGPDALKTPWGGAYTIGQGSRGDGEIVVTVSWQDGDGNPRTWPKK